MGFRSHGLATAFLLFPVLSGAQPAGPPPTDGAARVTAIEGGLAGRADLSGQAVWLTVGDPIRDGDFVRTSPDGHAEIALPGGPYLRLGKDSTVRLTRVESPARVEVLEGGIYLSRSRESGPVEIAAGRALVRPLAFSVTRVDSEPSDPCTWVAFSQGQAEVEDLRGRRLLDRSQAVGCRCPPREGAPAGWDLLDGFNDERELALREPPPPPPEAPCCLPPPSQVQAAVVIPDPFPQVRHAFRELFDAINGFGMNIRITSGSRVAACDACETSPPPAPPCPSCEERAEPPPPEPPTPVPTQVMPPPCPPCEDESVRGGGSPPAPTPDNGCHCTLPGGGGPRGDAGPSGGGGVVIDGGFVGGGAPPPVPAGPGSSTGFHQGPAPTPTPGGGNPGGGGGGNNGGGNGKGADNDQGRGHEYGTGFQDDHPAGGTNLNGGNGSGRGGGRPDWHLLPMQPPPARPMVPMRPMLPHRITYPPEDSSTPT